MDQVCQMVHMFSNQKSQFGKIFEGLEMEVVGIICDLWSIYGHFEYFMTIWYILWLFGIFYQEKSGNPAMDPNGL
jgi:hypothetical protein